MTDAEYEAELVVCAARLDFRLRQTVREWPIVADAVPPVPITDPTPNAGPIDKADFRDDWLALVEDWRAGRYTLPQAESKAGLFGGGRNIGYCLNPLIGEHTRCWYDPLRPARDRDFVLVHQSPERLFCFLENQLDDPELARIYGPATKAGAHVVKWFRAYRGEWYCSASDGNGWPLNGWHLGDCKVLGVLAHVELEEN